VPQAEGGVGGQAIHPINLLFLKRKATQMSGSLPGGWWKGDMILWLAQKKQVSLVRLQRRQHRTRDPYVPCMHAFRWAGNPLCRGEGTRRGTACQ